MENILYLEGKIANIDAKGWRTLSIILMKAVHIITISRVAGPIWCTFHARGLAMLVKADNQLPRLVP